MKVLMLERVLAAFEGLDDWLDRCGVPSKNDRIHALVTSVKKTRELLEQRRATKNSKPWAHLLETITDNIFFGLTEAIEFDDIFRAFSSDDPSILGPKLARALSGPLRPADETKKNTHGRNTMFELALAAEWKVRGLDVRLGDPDITLTLRGVPFLLECKRPFDRTGIRSNVRGAARQLKDKLDQPAHQGSMGIIAISVTRVFNRGQKVFIVPTEEWGQEELNNLLAELMQESSRHWEKASLHPRIIAVIFHVSTPAFIEDVGFISRMTYFRPVATVTEGPALTLFEEEVMSRYI